MLSRQSYVLLGERPNASSAPLCAGLVATFLSLSALIGCNGDIDVGAFTSGSTGAGSGGGSPAGGGDGDGGGDAGGGGGNGGAGGSVTGPTIEIHLRATTSPFPHGDGFSGQTPIDHRSGIRKFSLLKDASDTSPFTVFDFGQNWVEVGYNDGDDTLIYKAAVASLPDGKYTIARVVHSHVRYRVAATMHYNGLKAPGEFDNMQVLSDGTLIDGTLRDHGYFEYAFKTGAMEFPLKGENAPSPEFDAGGISAKFENGEWAYYFPVNLPLTPDVPADVSAVMVVNMYESFRWEDQAQPGYTPKVFDTTPTTPEPVKRFGANSFTVFLE